MQAPARICHADIPDCHGVMDAGGWPVNIPIGAFMTTQSAPLLARLPFYYGWVVVAIAFITMGIAVSSRTAFSLLYPPILDEFGWTRGDTAAAFSVGFAATIVTTPLYGVLMDRMGPRVVIPLGAVLVALGFVGATWIASPLGLYVTLGILAVGGSIGMTYIGHSMFLPNWFERKRGLAVGLAFSGAGVVGIFALPALQQVIEGYGWRTACLVVAACVVILLVPLNVFLQRRHPADLNLNPDGDPTPTAHSPARTPDLVVDRAWADTDWTIGKAARTARFWWVIGAYFSALFVFYAIQVHQTKFLIETGFDPQFAATALGLVVLFGVVGQIGIGAFSDFYGREWAWTVANIGFLLCSAALLLLRQWPSPMLMVAMVAVQGLLGYGLTAVYGAISLEIFSGRKFATIFSIISLFGNLGAAIGPWATGAIYDVAGSYDIAFWLCGLACAISIGCIWMAAPGKVRMVAGRAARAAQRV